MNLKRGLVDSEEQGENLCRLLFQKRTILCVFGIGQFLAAGHPKNADNVHQSTDNLSITQRLLQSVIGQAYASILEHSGVIGILNK